MYWWFYMNSILLLGGTQRISGSSSKERQHVVFVEWYQKTGPLIQRPGTRSWPLPSNMSFVLRIPCHSMKTTCRLFYQDIFIHKRNSIICRFHGDLIFFYQVRMTCHVTFLFFLLHSAYSSCTAYTGEPECMYCTCILLSLVHQICIQPQCVADCRLMCNFMYTVMNEYRYIFIEYIWRSTFPVSCPSIR